MSATIRSFHLQQGTGLSPIPRKIYVGGGPADLYSPLIRVDFEAKYGLKKFHGMGRMEGGSYNGGIVIGHFVGDLNELSAPTPPITIDAASMSQAFQDRQEIFARFESRVDDSSSINLHAVNSGHVDFYLHQFAEILLNHNKLIHINKLPSSWQKLIADQKYSHGLKPSKLDLARAFSWVIESFSDTPEAQIALSRRMIREDPSNPIAWWYLATLDTNHLRPLIDMDWQSQLNATLARMGSWDIGKKTLSKRFKESH